MTNKCLLWVGFALGITTAVATDLPVLRFAVDQLEFRAVAVEPSAVNLHWQGEDGQAYQYFSRLNASLEANDLQVLALMNAGIYGKDNQPAGLHVEQGKMLHAINTRKGHGNFHLQPNGVFLITQAGRARILTTQQYLKQFSGREAELRLATQSGPMLLINGKINPRLLPNSTSNYTRNGVCTTPEGQLFFIATAHSRTNFYQFTRASEQLGCSNTLYLDGNISKLYLAGQDSIFHFPHYVGILSVTHSTKD